jgi:hypothetical protein
MPPRQRGEEILNKIDLLREWNDSVAERVKVVKEKLDDLEQEGGVILNSL